MIYALRYAHAFAQPAQCEHVRSGPMCFVCWRERVYLPGERLRLARLDTAIEYVMLGVVAVDGAELWPHVLLGNLARVVQLAAAEARGWARRGMHDAPRFGY